MHSKQELLCWKGPRKMGNTGRWQHNCSSPFTTAAHLLARGFLFRNTAVPAKHHQKFLVLYSVTLKKEGALMQVRLNWTKFHLPHKTSGTTGAYAAKKREELLLLPPPLLLSTRAQQSSKFRAMPRAAEPQATPPQWVPQHSKTVTSWWQTQRHRADARTQLHRPLLWCCSFQH